MRKKRNAFMLLSAYFVLAVLFILGGVYFARTMAEARVVQRQLYSARAFYLAEAGIDDALVHLKNNYSWSTGLSNVSLGNMGSYTVSVEAIGQQRKLVSTGIVSDATPAITSKIEVFAQSIIPEGFYDNAIYASKVVDLNGNAYTVDGKIRYGTGPIPNTDNVTGEIIQDPNTNPLPKLNFEQLHSISESQANVYDATRLENVRRGVDSFPSSFWYSLPTDPEDPATGVPNVVYVGGDLVLRGNIGTLNGFFVVVGDVLTNPNAVYDSTINGNGQINGCIYTRGKFTINGGAGGLNVFGGVWAQSEAEMNGNATITYNRDYMKAIEALDINPEVQVLSWRQL